MQFNYLIDKLPPQNIEAEEAILGGILLDPEAIERVVDTLIAEAFYIEAHRDIYQAMVRLYSQSKPTDLLAVINWLNDYDMLTRVGGRNKLVTLVDRTVSAVNIDAIAELVMEKYQRRQLIKAGNEIVQLGYEQSIPFEEELDKAEQKIFSIRYNSQFSNEPQMLGDIGVEVFQKIERLNSGGELSAIPTGFYDLDGITSGGLRPGELIVVAARPSMGKSSFFHQIALFLSLAYGYPTMIFSLEMPKSDVYRRFLASESGIELGYLRSGKISPPQWELLVQAMGRLAEAKVLIEDSPCPTPSEIRSKVRKAIAKHGQLGLVVVDYLQLMADGSDPRLPQKIGEITRQLKLLARECNVPIVIGSQVNRGVEDRNNKRPMLSDLRDSGRIEEDADVVLFLYRDEYYYPDSPERGIAEIIIAKQRNGPVGTVKLLFDSQFCQFKNLVRSVNF